ncbi:MAG: hypothetical protein LBC75_08960 [Fibromonadaceae bacterium]|jgi:hypothetical protein|nr:hypothetical protein [Fibromonadaceae bacterium]
MKMKFLFTIALLALIGCAGNKPAKNLPTCEEFYDFYKGFSEGLSKNTEITADSLFNLSLEILEMAIKKYNCSVIITCNEKLIALTRCFDSDFLYYPYEQPVFYRRNDRAAQRVKAS